MARYPRASDSKEPLLLLDRIGAENETVSQTHTALSYPAGAVIFEPSYGKDFDAGRDWGQEEKGTTEDEMAGWQHRLNEDEFD